MNTDPYQFDARTDMYRYLAASYAKIGKMVQARHHAAQVGRHQPDFSAGSGARCCHGSRTSRRIHSLFGDGGFIGILEPCCRTERRANRPSSGPDRRLATEVQADRLFGSASSPAQHQSWEAPARWSRVELRAACNPGGRHGRLQPLARVPAGRYARSVHAPSPRHLRARRPRPRRRRHQDDR